MGKGWFAFGCATTMAIAATTAAATELTMAQFREQVAKQIVADHPGARVTPVGGDQLRIELPGGQVITSSLGRGYGIYEGNPADLPDILKGFSGSVRVSRAPATLQSIVILVRPLNPKMAMAKLARPLAGGMWAVVAQDLPNSFEFPSKDELRTELKLDEKAIWSRALDNTRKRIGIESRPLNPNQPVEISTGGYFASSLLADDAFWDSPLMLSQGPLVVFALARDNLYVVPLSSTAMVARLRQSAATVKDDPNGLTNDLIVRRNSHWETLH